MPNMLQFMMLSYHGIVLFNSLVSKFVPVHIPLSLQGGDCDHKYLINGRTWFLLLVPRYFVYLTGISTCYSVYSSRSAKKLDQCQQKP